MHGHTLSQRSWSNVHCTQFCIEAQGNFQNPCIISKRILIQENLSHLRCQDSLPISINPYETNSSCVSYAVSRLSMSSAWRSTSKDLYTLHVFSIKHFMSAAAAWNENKCNQRTKTHGNMNSTQKGRSHVNRVALTTTACPRLQIIGFDSGRNTCCRIKGERIQSLQSAGSRAGKGNIENS